VCVCVCVYIYIYTHTHISSTLIRKGQGKYSNKSHWNKVWSRLLHWPGSGEGIKVNNLLCKTTFFSGKFRTVKMRSCLHVLHDDIQESRPEATLTPNLSSWSSWAVSLVPQPLCPKYPSNRSWVRQTAGVDVLGKGKTCCPYCESNPDVLPAG
jgi:hypothetical protein